MMNTEKIIRSVQGCNPVGKVGLGYANTSTEFSSEAQGRRFLMQSLALNALSYNPHDRVSAQGIFDGRVGLVMLWPSRVQTPLLHSQVKHKALVS